MEITSSILGVSIVIVTVLIVFTFINYSQILSLKKKLENTQQALENSYSELKRVEHRSEDYTSQTKNTLNQQIEKLHEYVDSRVDKLGYKVYSDFDIKQKQTNTY